MRIAYLINQYPKVSHTFIRREILAMEKSGFDIKRVSIRPTETSFIDQQDEKERTKTHSLLQAGPLSILFAMFKCLITQPIGLTKATYYAWKIGRRSDRGLFIYMIYVAEACLLYCWVKSWEVEHIHVHFGTNPTAVALFCRLIGGPTYSFTSHGPEEYDKAQAIGLGVKIEHASFVAAISSFGRSQLFRWCTESNWEKIKIVHCGVDAEDFKHKPTAVPDARKLVCVGRLCEQKGQLLLVQAAAKVIQNGMPFELVLVGDGEMRSEIETLMVSLGVQDNIRITGWSSGEEVRRELSESRGLVLPSFAEGLPVVIMESFALGRPVISTYVAGIPELVRPEKNGWLCPASDVTALVQSMTEILSAPTDRLTIMGLNGRELVAKNHDIRKEADVLANAIRDSVTAEAKGHS